MLMGVGVPLIANEKGFLVLVSWFQKMFYVFKRDVVHIAKFRFRVFIDMKFTSKLL